MLNDLPKVSTHVWWSLGLNPGYLAVDSSVHSAELPSENRHYVGSLHTPHPHLDNGSSSLLLGPSRDIWKPLPPQRSAGSHKVWPAVVHEVGPSSPCFLATSPCPPPPPPCLWQHGEVLQGLKARKRETKEGIKSRNVP